ncbi:hypothetical protein [Providencia rettgeri]|uniref:hypothetical protein n=1 Tax=Providencia rettgeri TaxID=587 RepID=UPI0029D6CBE6|nr:hypothetical protein [Providencia rettgeri]MDX7324575.1 hypothetical protein [Providencia rettgeri]
MTEKEIEYLFSVKVKADALEIILASLINNLDSDKSKDLVNYLHRVKAKAIDEAEQKPDQLSLKNTKAITDEIDAIILRNKLGL